MENIKTKVKGNFAKIKVQSMERIGGGAYE